MLSERIKTLRKKKGISQEELALEVHVVRQTICSVLLSEILYEKIVE